MARKVPYAREKFEEKLMQQINVLLKRDFADPRLQFVSVTGVELSKDYSYATIMWDTFDRSKRGDAKAAIDGISGKLRSKLSKTLDVRHTPHLTFVYNSQFDSENHITNLLKETAMNKDSDDEAEDFDELDEEE